MIDFISKTMDLQIRINDIGRSQLWDDGAFLVVMYLHNLVAIAYYIGVLGMAAKFGELRWYRREPWLRLQGGGISG